jgi:hypothetical protein
MNDQARRLIDVLDLESFVVPRALLGVGWRTRYQILPINYEASSISPSTTVHEASVQAGMCTTRSSCGPGAVFVRKGWATSL